MAEHTDPTMQQLMDMLAAQQQRIETLERALQAPREVAAPPSARPTAVSRRGLLRLAGTSAAVAAAGAAGVASASRLTGTSGVTKPGVSTTVINYQGRLTNAKGKPITGKLAMTFRLYQNQNDPISAALWTEAYTGANAVQVTNGLFNVYLGSLNQTLSTSLLSQTMYLGLMVAPDTTEMQPRELLGSVPYALQAGNAATAGNAQQVNGFPASATPAANSILPLDASGQIPGGVVRAQYVSADWFSADPFTVKPNTQTPIPKLTTTLTVMGPSVVLVWCSGGLTFTGYNFQDRFLSTWVNGTATHSAHFFPDNNNAFLISVIGIGTFTPPTTGGPPYIIPVGISYWISGAGGETIAPPQYGSMQMGALAFAAPPH